VAQMPHRATSRKQSYAWWVLTPRSLGVTFAVIFFCRHRNANAVSTMAKTISINLRDYHKLLNSQSTVPTSESFSLFGGSPSAKGFFRGEFGIVVHPFN
jgi:hypothetical protein